jgi:glycosyltransferase involved in cell wall biosynthesis
VPTLLSVNNYYYYRGGAETVFLEHGRLLEHRGWSVVPFAMHHPRNLPSAWSEHFVDEIEFGSAYSPLDKARRAARVIYSAQARERLDRLLDIARPDLCHAHNIYHHISPSILGLLARRGVPVVLTLHDLKIACPAYQMLATDGICERCKGGKLYNVVAQRCIKQSLLLSSVVMAESVLHRFLGSYRDCVARFVVPSRFYIDKLGEWGWPSERFRHVPNFVEAERYEPCVRPGERFLYFGRLSREKGLQTLLSATARARVPLTIVGTGPDLESLRQTADRLSADVQFRGFLSGTPLHDAIREARAVVLPSEWYENAPMSVLEAYALGKPVIGARIGGIPELVQEDRTGLLFASGDEDALADALERLQSMPDAELASMGQAGRDWVVSEFSSRLYLDRILAIYRDLGVPENLR